MKDETSLVDLVASHKLFKSVLRIGELSSDRGLPPYDRSVLDAIGNMTDAVRRVEDACLLFRRYPSRLGGAKNPLTRDAWLTYHSYVYVVNLASIRDICLILVANVFDVGLHPRHVRLDILREHSRLKGSEVVKALDRLTESLKETITRRHGLVHRGASFDLDAFARQDGLRELAVVTWICSVAPKRERPVPAATLKQQWDVRMQRLERQLFEDARTYLRALLGVLTPLDLEFCFRSAEMALGVQHPARGSGVAKRGPSGPKPSDSIGSK